MIKKITLLTTAILLTGVAAWAQLTGAYTIGGATPDYLTITDARNALNAQGVSGPVVFNIRDGVYNEQVLFTAVTGASATNTITFQAESGDSSLVSWEFPSNTLLNPNYVVGFAGSSFININKVTINRTGTNNSARVIEFGGNTNNISISNSVLTNGIITGSNATACIVGSNSGTVDNLNTFSHNLISGGSFGIYWYGGSTVAQFETGNTFTNNTILNSTTRGVFFNYQADVTFSGNEVTTNSTVLTYYGISASGCNTLNYIGNKINCPLGGYGIFMQGCNATAGSEGTIANNFITVGGTAGIAYGLHINTCGYQNIYFNSINITSTDANNGRGLMIENTATNNIGIVNNNIVNSGTGYAVYFNAVTNIVVSQMNYNNLYKAGTNLGYYSGNRTNLAAWQTGSTLDANSVSFNPLYLSATDLHMPPTVVNDYGTPLTSVTNDIDGEARNIFSPDIGADEYAPFAEDLAAVKINYSGGQCGDPNASISAVIRNYGTVDQTNFDVNLEVSGTLTATETYTYTGTLLGGQTDTITFTTILNTTSGATLDVKVFSSLATDLYNLNDTVYKSFTIFGIPAAPSMLPPTPQPACPNSPITIDGTVGPTEDIVFYDAPVGGTILHVGHPWTSNFATPTTVYAETRSVTSGVPCLRFTEFELNDIGGEGDYLEIQNLSTDTIDATGWVIKVNDVTGNINSMNSGQWVLGVIAPGEIQYRCDACASTPNYWGTNIVWNPSAAAWAIMVDNTGNVVDFVSWGFDTLTLQTFNNTVNGFPITYANNIWSGASAIACASGNSVTRLGSSDHDDATDWTCEIETKGTANANLTVPFSSCGLGICGSTRVPVTINLFTAPVVNLGPDTTIAFPNTVVLDAGAGTAYIWSNGETTQTITTGNAGIYTVTVTDANGCTGTDEILVSVLTGINDISLANIFVHPNPATNELNIDFSNITLSDKLTVKLIDRLGKTAISQELSNMPDSFSKKLDLKSLSNGIYILQISNQHSILQRKIVKQ